MAIMIVCFGPLDQVLYSILGHDRSRVTLLELCDPYQSAVCKALHHLCRVLSCWGPDVEEWFLLSILGVDFSCLEMRLCARTQLLQLHCGVFDHFELRFSRPPYSLSKLCRADVDPAVIEATVKSFMAERLECLPLMCQRLRTLCPNEAALFSKAPDVIRAWGRCTMTAIDLSERSHAQMRVDVQSPGRARSSTASSNRVFCRQVLASHMNRGGRDITKLDMALLNSASSAASAQPPLQHVDEHDAQHGEGSAHRKQQHPGSAMLRFQNVKLKSWKRLHAPHRPVSTEERNAVFGFAKVEWHVIQQDPEQHASWLLLNRAEFAKKSLPALVDAPRVEQFGGLWGCSQDCKFIVPVPIMIEQGIHRVASEHGKVWNDPSLAVNSPLVDRVSTVGQDSCVFGCYSAKKNFCRFARCLSSSGFSIGCHDWPVECMG